MRVRRTKPYVCVDVDYAEHFRFQNTTDLDAAAESVELATAAQIERTPRALQAPELTPET